MTRLKLYGPMIQLCIRHISTRAIVETLKYSFLPHNGTAETSYSFGRLVTPVCTILESGAGDPGGVSNLNRCKRVPRNINNSIRARCLPRQARPPDKNNSRNETMLRILGPAVQN